MTGDQAIVFGVLAGCLVMFAWGRWRYDLVALVAMLAVVTAGLVPAAEALAGFGHPAVITVAAVLVISRALRNSGIVDLIARRLMPLTERPLLHIAALTGTVTVCSAFMNNVGALALMLPVAIATANASGRSPAILLMPLAFGSILGGLMTMIGTPPNVIVATYRAELSGEPFRMFDFSPVGAVIAFAGVVFVALIGWRLLPKERQAQTHADRLFEINDYLAEVRIPEEAPWVGQRIGEIEALTGEEMIPVGLVRGRDKVVHPSRWRRLQAGDTLIVKAGPDDLKQAIDEAKLELVAGNAAALEGLRADELQLTEAVITAGSPLDGRNIHYLRRRSGDSVSLLALARSGEAIRNRLRRVRFASGDVLLLQGDRDTLGDTMTDLGLLPLAERDLQLGLPRRIGTALAVFAIALALGATGTVPVTIAFLGAIAAYVVLDILPIRDAYRDIDWPVIVLLGAMIPVGRALETTGATELIANSIVGATAGLPAWAVLTLVLVVTMTLSDLVNNAATALVMAPIAAGIAAQLGANADPFLMAVAVGASCAFLTPIGHQSNTLVMGPGGYRFGDYWRMGLPLEVMIVAIGVPMILLVWPL
ncbi:MAG: SLC13 family permease [Minwuiales bacterium]|nr:SLC13 family permease [Minwuiales bacterium]